MNPTSPTNPKPTWVRLATAVGIACAVISWCGGISSFVIWHINANNARFYDHVIGPVMLLALLITVFCGLILFKHRKIGRILLILGVILFIIELLSPEL
jgi:tryptophan-rich sensory protein